MSQLDLRQATLAASDRNGGALRPGELGALSALMTGARSLAPPSLLPAWSVVGLGVVCVCAMIWAGMVGAHDCRVAPIPLALGTDSAVSVALPSDTPCTILVAAGATALADLAIDTLPEHGSLMPRGRTGVTYRPAPRFNGNDSFAFSIRGSGTPSRVSVVRVRAIVK